VRVAAISYDSESTLKRFADTYRIGYPMLSDKGSAVIRKFGILNENIPQGHMFYGIPFPGDYLIGTDLKVRDKAFKSDYQARPGASEVLLKNFGASAGGPVVTIKVDDLLAVLTLSSGSAVPGRQLGIAVDFTVAPGWHIYGQPIADNYVATSISFESEFISEQSLNFPKPTPVEFKSLGETLPAYSGSLRAIGSLLIKANLKSGDYKLKGTLRFQECSDQVCKLPNKIEFEVPIRIEAMLMPAR
jgi:DsbC/DsbD-like thiol-disulfide interchange protein